MGTPQGPEKPEDPGPSSSLTPGDLPGGVWHGIATAGLVLSVPVPHPEEHTVLLQILHQNDHKSLAGRSQD